MRQHVLTILIQPREQEYVDVKEDLLWLGFNWSEELYSSDYFQQLYDWAISMIKMENVDSQSSQDMAAQKELNPSRY
jgi:glutaminyl-tRNA synthetase